MQFFWHVIGNTFSPDRDIPDLSGKVIIVTGGNVGLGKETILQLAKHNPRRIWMASRNESASHEAIQDIKAQVPNASIAFLKTDLTSFDSIQKAADTFKASETRLDILINNAGIMACQPGQTQEGYEIQFGTNHVGHALLTKLLLPTLEKTAALSSSDVRIVNVSSDGHIFAPKGGFIPEAVSTDMSDYYTITRYGQGKLANVLHAKYLASRYPGIKCVSIHPGAVKTSLGRGIESTYTWMSYPLRLVGWLVFPVATGALNQLWAATSKDVVTGAYYRPVGVQGAGGYTEDEEVMRKLEEWTEAQIG